MNNPEQISELDGYQLVELIKSNSLDGAGLGDHIDKLRGRSAKAKEWLKFRRRYLKIVRPDDFGYYKCALCHMVVNEKDVTLDHIIPRSRRPDLVFEFSNIQLTHYSCNAEKGSHVERA